MLNLLKKLFGLSGTELSSEDLRNGTIVDVRSPAEFQGGHVAGSINIPLQELDQSILKLRKLKTPIITCCASGNRSGMAARQLNSLDIKTVNGGSWQHVNRQMK